jgi:hypothetical protein
MEFKPGNLVELEVIGIKESNEKKFIYLSDGEKDTYRVVPYDYQLEWEGANLPDKLTCYVKSINIWGLPYLIQSRKHTLQDCYTDKNSEYAFKVVAVKKDKNTDARFYDLKDAFGLHHRYYPEEYEIHKDIGDIFSLLFNGIEDKGKNNAFLNLSSLKIPPLELQQEVSTCFSYDFESIPEPKIDPRRESSFGYEDENREFKSSIVFPAGDVSPDIDKQLLIISKTIAGFQNHKGGTLLLGVNDSGEAMGIHHDFPHLNSSENDAFEYSRSKDGYELKIRNAVKYFLGNTSNSNISFEFDEIDGKEYCLIKINEVLKPVFLHNIKLYQRAGNMTQLLKGDEITYFIEERFLKRNYNLPQQHPVENNELEEVQEDEEELVEQSLETDRDSVVEEAPAVYKNSGKNLDLELPDLSRKKVNDKVWYHMTFYKNGGWSYQKNKVKTGDVELEIAIPDSLKKERLLMVYDNGCVNVVCPYDIIKPRGTKGRRFRTRERIYSNGWNTNAKLMNVFCVNRDDLIVFDSIDTYGVKWVKAHKVSAISVHSSLQLEGNVLINPRLNASIERAVSLPLDYYHIISSLVLKDHQTSGYLGIKRTDRNYQKTFIALEKLIENYKKYWEN